jgi:hypothetical protein
VQTTNLMTASRWIKYLVSVGLGNGVYFALYPHLPAAARHQFNRVDVGILVDLWFCLLVYGLLELTSLVRRWRDRT